jgi:hypothetical protein
MKRAVAILTLGAFAGVVAYCAVFYSSTAEHRQFTTGSAPELAWLKKEFNLSKSEFERISKLHAAYQPHCKEMCERIDEQNAKIRDLLGKTDGVTPEVQEAMTESARLRVECQTMMLKHVFEVSRNMPPEQGKRYLQWVQEKTFLPRYGMRDESKR